MEENIETGGPAFPCHPEIIPHRDHDFAGMTLRQYAAIKLRVPNSGTDWLDEMIREARRDELAAQMMQAVAKQNPGMWRGSVAKEAYAMAGAMFAAKEDDRG